MQPGMGPFLEEIDVVFGQQDLFSFQGLGNSKDTDFL
jgi:hypothetical protein